MIWSVDTSLAASPHFDYHYFVEYILFPSTETRIAMPSVKQSSSSEDFLHNLPNKSAKLSGKDEKDSWIKELEAPIVELHEFIIKEDMLKSTWIYRWDALESDNPTLEAPQSIHEDVANHPCGENT